MQFAEIDQGGNQPNLAGDTIHRLDTTSANHVLDDQGCVRRHSGNEYQSILRVIQNAVGSMRASTKQHLPSVTVEMRPWRNRASVDRSQS